MRHAHPQPRFRVPGSRVLASRAFAFRVGACRVGAFRVGACRVVISLVLIPWVVTSLGAPLLIDGSRGQFLYRQRRAGREPRPVLPGLRHREVRPVLRVVRLQLRHGPGPAIPPLDPAIPSHPVRITDPIVTSQPVCISDPASNSSF